jgi:Protein of unknown function with HXXEE motif
VRRRGLDCGAYFGRIGRGGRVVNGGYGLGRWVIDNWSRMALPFAVLALVSLPLFLSGGNLSVILLYTLLPVYMIHQYEEHAHGRFVEFFNATIGRGHEVLTKVSAFWINILEVWLLFLVTFYLSRYVAPGIAFVPIWLTVFNGLTHVIAYVSLGRYNPGLYTSLALFFPWGAFLLIYFSGVVASDLLFNVVGVVTAVIGHALIVVYALRRRGKLEGRSVR